MNTSVYSGHTSAARVKNEYRVTVYGQSFHSSFATYSNKRKARTAALEIARGNVTRGQSASWMVENLDGETVYHGTVRG